MYLLLLASFAGYWAFLGLRYPRVNALHPFVIVSGILTLLYIAGLFGALALGSIAIQSAGLLLLAWSIWRCRKNPVAGLKSLSQPAVVLFFALLAIGIFQLHDATFLGWDELGSWGPYGKEIITTGALIGPQGNDIGYFPPGLMLIHYYLSSHQPYRESVVYIAQYVSLLTCLTVLLHKASWRSPLAWMAVLLSSYFVVRGMEGGFVTIYQDATLSILFAAAIVAYFILRSARLEIFLLPALFAMPLIKPVGLFFAVSVLALIFLDTLILSLGAAGTAGGAASGTGLTRSLLRQLRGVRPARLALFGMLVVAPFAAHESWTLRLHVLDFKEGGFSTDLLTRTNVEKVFFTDAYAKGLDAASGNREAEQLKTIRTIRERFALALLQKPLNEPSPSGFFPSARGIPLIGWYGLAAAAFLYPLLFGTGVLVKARYAGLFLGLSLLLPVYLGINLMVYALAMVPLSGLTLDSYERYMAIFMGSLLLVGFACMIVRFEDLPKRDPFPGASGLCALGLATALLIGQTPGADRVLRPEPKLELRKSMEPMLRFFEQHVGLSQRTYIVTQNSTGFAYWILRFEMTPRPTSNLHRWSLGKKHCARDVWTADISPAEWANRLISGKFDFLLIAQSDPQFWNTYGSLFQNGSKDESGYFLYKVEPGPGETVRLAPVEPDQQKMVPRMIPDWTPLPDSGPHGIEGFCRS